MGDNAETRDGATAATVVLRRCPTVVVVPLPSLSAVINAADKRLS
jgi:hypothetical protein